MLSYFMTCRTIHEESKNYFKTKWETKWDLLLWEIAYNDIEDDCVPFNWKPWIEVDDKQFEWWIESDKKNYYSDLNEAVYCPTDIVKYAVLNCSLSTITHLIKVCRYPKVILGWLFDNETLWDTRPYITRYLLETLCETETFWQCIHHKKMYKWVTQNMLIKFPVPPIDVVADAVKYTDGNTFDMIVECYLNGASDENDFRQRVEAVKQAINEA